MIVILTNIPTPYRTAFFNELNLQLLERNSSLHVLYCAKTEPRRFWEFNPSEQKYNFTILKGFHPEFKETYPHINLSVCKVLKKLNPEQIIIAGAWNTPTMLQALYFYNKKIKKFFWSEGHQSAQRSSNSIVNKLRNSIYKKFDGFLVPNENSKKYVTDLISPKILPIGYLPNTIDEEFFNENLVPTQSELRLKNNISLQKKIILLISSIDDRKGVLPFVEAYFSLEENVKDDIEIIILGTGELETKLKAFLTKNNITSVHLLGHVDKIVVREFLKIADVFALPTKLDPNPLSPIEASMMKKPLLLSNKAGNFNELLFSSTGIEIEEITKESIALSLNKFANLSKSQLNEMGQNAYQNVLENYTRKQAAYNLIQFLNSTK
ncbi:glycosyltransferase family 4 protein [Flavobacterium urocaniciphilum]|uniref:Glycosyltransferase involved in cell wall bisynthesis n=1 Tax=Flavobacterium urocaniciphilum TaxID=1299341 RepID=A0A1H8YRH7_9FLAO|nr:glycosyltransferase family 4 protein [Flavobacterium urocaniciphilum]SEP54776.1 Glycosyltransferase involved in cell wall bisynthesis [Flavobacterium urocaniciphilum]